MFSLASRNSCHSICFHPVYAARLTEIVVLRQARRRIDLVVLVDAPSRKGVKAVKMTVYQVARKLQPKGRVRSRSKQTLQLFFEESCLKAYRSAKEAYFVVCGIREWTMYEAACVERSRNEQNGAESVRALWGLTHAAAVKPHQIPEVKASRERRPPCPLNFLSSIAALNSALPIQLRFFPTDVFPFHNNFRQRC